MKLFEEGIKPSDVDQGGLGNCWLLAAIATLAEFEGVVESVFVSRETGVSGRYTVQLWDDSKMQFRMVTVDDYFPCSAASGKPVFASPSGTELWVLLLEKAFAKHFGCYGNLEGGLPLVAMHLMTGDNCLHWSKNENNFSCMDLAMKTKDYCGKTVPKYEFRGTGETVPLDGMFKLIMEYVSQGCPMGAGTSGKDNTRVAGRDGGNKGIVPGHAYSVLDAKELFGFRLIRLRNPWGRQSWTGDWGPNSPEWDKHPNVKAACNVTTNKEEGGTFWMPWDAFLQRYDMVDVCCRSIGLKDLKLKINEVLLYLHVKLLL